MIAQTEEDILTAYNGAMQHFAELNPAGSYQQVIEALSAVTVAATLGWVLGLGWEDTSEDVSEMMKFIHRENPSILKKWSEAVEGVSPSCPCGYPQRACQGGVARDHACPAGRYRS